MARSVKLEITANVKGLVDGARQGQRALSDLAAGSKRFGPAVTASTAKASREFLTAGKAAHALANQHGLLYDSAGRLNDQFGRSVSESAAAALGLKSLSDEARYASEQADKAAEAWQTVGKSLLVGGAGLVAGAGMVINTYADFDKQMSSVQAATHETTENMGLLREAAIKAGADTAFSGVEAAQGIEELAKAGVETKDILAGGLDGALSLAAAGQLEVGEASEFAASAMTQFKLQGKDIPHIADLLAAGAGKAQGEVRDMGLALSYAGVPAHQMGASIEETTGAIALFASNGIIGERAGTALRSMFVSMANPTAKTKKLMDELGISFEDSNGKFIGLSASAQVLQDKLAGQSEMARNAALAQIFGNEALGAAQVLYAGGAKAVDEWTDKVDDAGFAAETAAIKQDNLAGDLEKLGGSFESVFLKAGGSGNNALRGVVQTVEGLVDAIGGIPGPALQFGTVAAGVVGGLGVLGGGLITLTPKLKATHDILRDLGPAGQRASRALSGLGKTIGGITAVGTGLLIGKEIIEAINEAARSGKPDVDEYFNLISTGGDLKDALNLGESDGWSGALFKDSAEEAKKYYGTVTVEAGNAKRAIEAIGTMDDGGGLVGWFQKNLSFGDVRGATEDALQLQEAMRGIATAFNQDGGLGQERLAGLAKQLELTDGEVAQLINSVPELKSALVQLATDQGIQLDPNDDLALVDLALGRIKLSAPEAAEGIAGTGDALDGAAGPAQELAMSLDDVLDAMFQLGVLNRDVQASEDAFQAAIDDVTASIEKNGTSLDSHTEKGRANRQAMRDLADSGQSYVEALAQQGASEGEIQSAMQGTYDSLIKAAGQFGITGEEADALARELIGIPDDVDIETWMDENARQIAEATANAIEAIPGYKKVGIAVSEDGTVGQVQAKIDTVTGKTEYVFVTDDGTITTVQAGIATIDGKEVPVYVDDDGTVYGTQGKITGIKGKDVTITADAETGAAETELNNAARPRTAKITGFWGGVAGNLNSMFPGLLPGGYTGGLVGQLIQGRAGGGLVPGAVPLNSQGDNVLAMVGGKPFGLRSGEMVINEQATRENYPLLKAINDGTTTPQAVARYAAERYAPAPAAASGSVGSSVSIGDIIVHGAGDPERAARAVEDRIIARFAAQGVRIGK